MISNGILVTRFKITIVTHPTVFTYENRKICKIIFNDDNLEMIFNHIHPIPSKYTHYVITKCDDVNELTKNITEYLNEYKVNDNNDFYYEEAYKFVSKYLLNNNIPFYIKM